MDNLIEISNARKAYEGFALKGVSLNVPAGCVTGFVGSNGAGKTTTIKAALGILPLDEGSVKLLGVEVGEGDARLAHVKERVGVVFDTCPFPDEMCCGDIQTIGRAAFPQWDSKRCAEYLERFGLDGKKKVKDLSRGMGMKLQLAFALSHEPQLLVLDEATAGLDPLARDELLDILRDFMRDETCGILLSSHITSDLEKIADYIVCIDGGAVAFSCSVEEICDVAGIIRCSDADASVIERSGLFAQGAVRTLRSEYFVDVLVPDRMRLRAQFPQMACERVSIEDYMRLMLKGEIR